MMSLFLGESIAQANSFKPLKLGEHVPEYTFQNLINYPSKTASLADFRGKLLIVDFWNSGCASCIDAWPKMEELQKKFAGKIQILLLNETEGEDVVRSIFERRKKLTKVTITLPSVCKDTQFGEMFPHKTFPHVVWISPDGTLQYVTAGNEVNSENITAILEKKQLSMEQKEGVKYDVDFNKPLFVAGNGGNGDHILFQSVLSGYYPGIYGTTAIGPRRGILSNCTVPTMLRYLFKGETTRFGALNFFPKSRTELRVADSSIYVDRINSVVQYQNYYTYQLLSKEELPYEKMRSLMLADIRRYFGINYKFEKKTKKCLVLKSVDSTLFRYKGGDLALVTDSDHVVLNDVTIEEFIQHLMAMTKYHSSPYPFVDETGFTGMLGGIKFECNVADYKELRQHLAKYGLKLDLEDREVNVLVIFEETM